MLSLNYPFCGYDELRRAILPTRIEFLGIHTCSGSWSVMRWEEDLTWRFRWDHHFPLIYLLGLWASNYFPKERPFFRAPFSIFYFKPFKFSPLHRKTLVGNPKNSIMLNNQASKFLILIPPRLRYSSKIIPCL